MTPATVTCRAAVSCDGTVSASTWEGRPWDDATWDGRSLVCYACYITIEPLMRMNTEDTPRAADEAIVNYRASVNHVRQHANPAELVIDANQAAALASEGSPYWTSARFLAGMAQAEVERRAAAEAGDGEAS